MGYSGPLQLAAERFDARSGRFDITFQLDGNGAPPVRLRVTPKVSVEHVGGFASFLARRSRWDVEDLTLLVGEDRDGGYDVPPDSLRAVLERLREGQSYSTALGAFPDAFPELYVASVRARHSRSVSKYGGSFALCGVSAVIALVNVTSRSIARATRAVAAERAGVEPMVLDAGESVMLGAAPILQAAGLNVSAAVSRQGRNMVDVVAKLRASHVLGKVVIIQTGTNGPVDDSVFAALMQLLPPRWWPISRKPTTSW